MLPDFPLFKQPHSFGCLPTCVQAVLAYYGENVSYQEVSEWCRELPEGGCFWSDAITGLTAQGYEVEEITTGEENKIQALDRLRQIIVQEGTPVVTELSMQIDDPGHAVVVIGIVQAGSEMQNTENVVFMVPDRGRHGDSVRMPIDVFFKRWQMRDLKAFIIGGE